MNKCLTQLEQRYRKIKEKREREKEKQKQTILSAFRDQFKNILPLLEGVGITPSIDRSGTIINVEWSPSPQKTSYKGQLKFQLKDDGSVVFEFDGKEFDKLNQESEDDFILWLGDHLLHLDKDE